MGKRSQRPYEHGALLNNEGGVGLVQVASTLKCCHCGMHFNVETAGGHRCPSCDEMTCRSPQCMITCVPEEKMLERIEAAGAARLLDRQRVTFELSVDEYAEIQRISNEAELVVVSGAVHLTRQLRVNAFWIKIGQQQGFDPKTVGPAPGILDERYFQADLV